jgi:two-component system, cell cycle response regulator DivK
VPRTPAPSSVHPSPSPLVLLVEDNDDNRAMYRHYLEWEGFTIAEATDGLQALGQAATLMPAAIVMDMALPRLDGWEAVRRLKADPRTRHIPVLAVTAHAFVDDARTARAAGCDGYLAKPCLPEDLARTLRSLIKATVGGSRRDRLALVEGGQSQPAKGSRQVRPATSRKSRAIRSTSPAPRGPRPQERAVEG